MKILLMKIAFNLFLFTQFIISQEYNKTVFNIEIASESIKGHTEILASDDFEGRGTGTNGGNLAAKYIASEFEKYGLKPVGDNNSFYQNIPMHGSYPLKSSELKIYSGNDEILLNLGNDYLLYKSGQQTFTPVPLPLVFVGFGIVAPEYDYNDYQEIEVEGKIVVFLEGEPESDDPEFFNGEAPTVYNYPISKQRIALSRGAAGSILIPDVKNKSWEKLVDEFAFEDINLAYSASNNLSMILNPDVVDHIFKNSGFDYSRILEMKNGHTLKSFPLNISLTFKGEYLQRDFLAQNVAGMIESNDSGLKDSYLIISAHYDHLGIGPMVNGDSIYNGALDNAIGVSVLLELARQFSESNNSVKRSIIFLAVTGEEKGLLGSTYYTDNPLVPLYKTIANLNIDGIALFRDFQTVVGVGSEFSTLENVLSDAAANMGLQIEPIPPQFKVVEAFNQSDQLSFASAGIPSILVLEGTKNKNKTEAEVLYAFIDYMIHRYHTPFDDLDQEIDYLAAAQHAAILFNLVYSLSNSDEVPEWKAGSPFINARLRSIAEKR